MDKPPTFVGIDVSKRRLDIHLRPSGEGSTIDHDDEGVAALVERLAALAPTLVVLEDRRPGGPSRGGPGRGRAAGRGRQPAPGARLRARDRPAGEDHRLDAAVIARFAEAVRPPARPLPDEAPPPPGRPGGAPAAAARDAGRRAQPAPRWPIPPCTRASTPTCAGSASAWTASSATWPRRSGRARPGGPRRSCCARCRASGRSARARSWPSCPSSARSPAARSAALVGAAPFGAADSGRMRGSCRGGRLSERAF